MAFVRHNDGRVVLEAGSNVQPTSVAHAVLVLLTALGGVASFPVSYSVFVTGFAAFILGFRAVEAGTYRSKRFTTLAQRLEILPLPLVATDYRGPPPEQELRIDGQRVPLRSARFVGMCEETKSGILFKRWPVYLVFEDQVVLVRTCTSLVQAQKLREELAAELDIPKRDLEPHNDWLQAQEYPGTFLPAIGLALFYVSMMMAYVVASVTSFFTLADASGAALWATGALATLGMTRLFRRALVRGVERELDPVVERNLKEGVFSDVQVRVEEEVPREHEEVEEVEDTVESPSLAEPSE